MKTLISLIAAVAFATAAISCKKETDPHAHHKMEAAKVSGSPHDAHRAQGEPPASVPSGASLYQFHDMFTDQNGKQLMLHQLQGKYVVVAMFYATCTAICPRIAAEMLRLEKNLSPSQRANTRFLMISFDHERDNPANLQKFIMKMHLTDSFVLLTGKAESIREVAAALGVNYKKQSDGEFAHSSLFTLLSPEGEISLQHAGLSISVDNFRDKIRP